MSIINDPETICKKIVDGANIHFIYTTLYGTPIALEAMKMTYREVTFYIEQVKEGNALCIEVENEY